jgi:hypothetical protein
VLHAPATRHAAVRFKSLSCFLDNVGEVDHPHLFSVSVKTTERPLLHRASVATESQALKETVRVDVPELLFITASLRYELNLYSIYFLCLVRIDVSVGFKVL